MGGSGARYHRLSTEEAVAELESDARHGLTSAEALRRLEDAGPNQLRRRKPAPVWRRFLGQFRDALVILLIIATAVSWIVWHIERETDLPYESLAILAIVVLNAVLGFVQEERAEKALLALREMAAPEAKTIRDAEAQTIPAREVVPGDILLIEEGDTIPADARLIEVVELKTLEASLTGESLPSRKSTNPIEGDAALGDMHNMVFSGTAAAYGRGRAVVTATGMNTEFGKIAVLLEEARTEPTPLQRELDLTGKRLGMAVVLIALVIVATLLVVEGSHDPRTLLDALLFGVALAVAAVPEGLAAIVTVVLAIGVQRMAGRGAIVRKLPSVETLGSATVIASDKTGTLTRNQMTVRVLVTYSGRTEVEGTGYIPEGEFHRRDGSLTGPQRAEIERLLLGAALDNNAKLTSSDGAWSIIGDPTEGALVVAARKAGIETREAERRFHRVRELPFSSERKMMSTVHEDREHPGRRRIWVKGAPDVLLSRCTEEYREGQIHKLTEARRAEIRQFNHGLAGDAFRTLAVAFRDVPPELDWQHSDSAQLERDLVFVGIGGMIDPPRPEVPQAVTRAREAGVRPIMITGDHPATALAIARELGIESQGGAITGLELEQMSIKDLSLAVGRVSVFARVNPGHKMRIVDALQQRGEVVAMTGDGVNDAPALKAADIGVAMGIAGTDVAKEASDIVLTDDNFATIVAAVEEGRAIFANMRKFLRYLLSSNAGEVLTMFLGVLLAGPLGLRDSAGLILPLVPTQILWINLITDGPPALALGLDPPDQGGMSTPPRPPEEHVITGSMWITVGLVGIVMSAGTLLVLDASLPGGFIEGTAGTIHGRTMAFTTLVLFQLFNAFNSRSEKDSALAGALRNRWLTGSVALSLMLQVVAVSVALLQKAFQTMSLDLRDWVVCFLVASSALWTVEIWKAWARRFKRARS